MPVAVVFYYNLVQSVSINNIVTLLVAIVFATVLSMAVLCFLYLSVIKPPVFDVMV